MDASARDERGSRVAEASGPPPALSASRRSLTWGQGFSVIAVGAGLVGWVWRDPAGLHAILSFAVPAIFLACALWRLALILASGRRRVPQVSTAPLPRYTVVAALHDEAEVLPQLVENLAALDYPADRLEGFLALEAHDHETIEAAYAADRPDWLSILIVPPGEPRTKPRALNHALARATGRLITVYDAEDDPDPLQLREAAACFARDATGRLACLQAPLRIRRRTRSPEASPFLDRQFAVEYAALFEVVLPGMTRLGLPFPLGGTSNHFRVDILKRVGGWDAWNVTEDADLGFRLWRAGYRLGVLTRPTWETPPGGLDAWLPQRTRWMKGFMQTWGVHTRRPLSLGLRGLLALVMTVGVSLASAAVHAPSVAWVAASVLVAAVAGLTPSTPIPALGVLMLGAGMAWVSAFIGARRAGIPYSLIDVVQAPAYWSLLSLAFVHAAWRLVTEPFAWDKTRHRPDPEPDLPPETGAAALDAGPPVRLSSPHGLETVPTP
ncbi:MAG: glycosyltransferase [Brevundimonas sp.]|nr:glycosyltransferase [Brevundimonas sp.]